MTISDNHRIISEQRDFWDSLHTDILGSCYEDTKEDYLAFIERNYIFAIISGGTSSREVIALNKMLGLGNYAYMIILELTWSGKTGATGIPFDDMELHHFIKQKLKDKSCALGPLISTHLSLIITHDQILSQHDYKEESTAVCKELITVLKEHFNLLISAGIGRMQSMHTIFTSFTDALSCLTHSNADSNTIHYLDIKSIHSSHPFDYHVTQKLLLESLQQHRAEAYDYFGVLMNYIRPFSDTAKRNRIIELLALSNNAWNLGNFQEGQQIDYMNYLIQLMNYSGDQLIDYASQLFLLIIRIARPQNSINYSNHIVQATKEYLEKHYADDISLENMAEQVNMSPQYLSKLIKKSTGFNFIEWLSMLRVKKAKELLTSSNLTVKEVCFMVGYKDPNYFSRIFKKRIGITPSEYVRSAEAQQ